MINRLRTICIFSISTLLVFAILLVSYGPTEHTKRAYGLEQVSILNDIKLPFTIESASANTLSALSNAGSFIANKASAAGLAALNLKEWTLDGVAFALINIMIKQITKSIVIWINSGFEGSPGFLTDFSGFLLDVADQVAGDFITELGLGFMCSPFKLEVQLTLALQYQRGRNYDDGDQCRLSDVVANIDGFMNNGNFADGGWDGWFAMTLEPSNNPYGALVTAQSELGVRLTNAKGEQIKLFDFGEGFLSFETCDTDFDEDGGEIKNCSISTPGAVIEDQVNFSLGSGQRRIEMADEINEILGALFAQLAQQALTGAAGLLGLTSSGFNAQGFSYIEASAGGNDADDAVGLVQRNLNPIETAILDIEDYLTLLEEVINRIDTAEAHPSLNHPQCTNPPTLPNTLASIRLDALEERGNVAFLLADLNAVNDVFKATTSPEGQLAILTEFSNLQASGLLITGFDVAEFETKIIGTQTKGLLADISAYQSSVDSFCNAQEEDRRRSARRSGSTSNTDNDVSNDGDGGDDF